jgi:hypothetical protein
MLTKNIIYLMTNSLWSIPLAVLSLAFIGNVTAGDAGTKPWCGSPDIFDKET